MLRRLRVLFATLALAFLAVAGVRVVYPSKSQAIALKPLPLDSNHPGIRRLGDLIFLNAWELRSDNQDFGGISALTVLADGRFIGIGDAGTLIGFGMGKGHNMDRPFIAPLPGKPLSGFDYRDWDSEGIAYNPGSGEFWVSFEANHAIRRYSRSFSRVTGSVEMSGRHKWAPNKGIEALVRLPDGRFVAIAENLEQGLHEGYLFSGDPVEKGTVKTWFQFRPPAGYRVTDAVLLSDGRLMLLNRSVGYLRGFSAKLSILELSQIGRNAIVAGEVVATLGAPLLVDNMEGIAVTPDKTGDIIWLISDNNFNIFQRTLLMKFRLAERQDKKKPEAVAAPGFDSL
ncbi:MAG: esterase-like activity of phytase family protein [Sphingomonadaceae bacterium]|nr:esterase-like activity of phytase family protein [Sphingomonadaceae bacterium]